MSPEYCPYCWNYSDDLPYMNISTWMLKMLRSRDCDSLKLHIKWEITEMVQSPPVTVKLLEKFSCTSYSNMDFSLFQQPIFVLFMNQSFSFELSMDLYCKRYFEFKYLHTVSTLWGTYFSESLTEKLHSDFWSSNLPSHTLENNKEISYILLFRNNLL